MDSHDVGETAPEAVVTAGEPGSHVLLLPYPSQGHVHPMLQFGKRLVLHGLQPTLAVTRFILATCTPGAAALLGGAVRIVAAVPVNTSRHPLSNILLIRTRSHSASLLPVSRYLLSFSDQIPII
jgi:hypothetical protein